MRQEALMGLKILRGPEIVKIRCPGVCHVPTQMASVPERRSETEYRVAAVRRARVVCAPCDASCGLACQS